MAKLSWNGIKPVDGEIYTSRYTSLQAAYEATIILSLDAKNKLNLIKNRHGPRYKDMPINDAVDIISTMLSKAAFDGRMELFQEGMKINFSEAIRNILAGKELVVKEK